MVFFIETATGCNHNWMSYCKLWLCYICSLNMGLQLLHLCVFTNHFGIRFIMNSKMKSYLMEPDNPVATANWVQQFFFRFATEFAIGQGSFPLCASASWVKGLVCWGLSGEALEAGCDSFLLVFIAFCRGTWHTKCKQAAKVKRVGGPSGK